jgi:hypothetical protein
MAIVARPRRLEGDEKRATAEPRVESPQFL